MYLWWRAKLLYNKLKNELQNFLPSVTGYIISVALSCHDRDSALPPCADGSATAAPLLSSEGGVQDALLATAYARAPPAPPTVGPPTLLIEASSLRSAPATMAERASTCGGLRCLPCQPRAAACLLHLWWPLCAACPVAVSRRVPLLPCLSPSARLV